MTTFIAYANIQQPFPFDEIPRELVPENLHTEPKGNSRITQRHQCRRLAHFLLWQLLKTAEKSTALLGRIYRTQSDRPQFPVENIDFNISHSGDWVAVLLHINESEKSAVGIDIDPQAILASRNNAEQNGVADRLQLFLSDAKPSDLKADVVVANILAGPLKELYPVISQLVKPNGDLGLSGILATQAQSVCDAYAERFVLAPVAEREEWCRITGKLKA